MSLRRTLLLMVATLSSSLLVVVALEVWRLSLGVGVALAIGFGAGLPSALAILLMQRLGVVAGSGAGSRHADLSTELSRSRRYEHPFVLLRIPAEERQGRQADLTTLGSMLRSMDRVWEDEGDVFVLLPETNRAMGEAFLSRLRKYAPELVPAETVGFAAFPDDALTSNGLLAQVRRGPQRVGAENPDVVPIPVAAPADFELETVMSAPSSAAGA